jgi:CheY-like chemotaxis protein
MGDTHPPAGTHRNILRWFFRLPATPPSAIIPGVARLLLIDDDPAVSVTLARMLEFCGHQVTRIESAERGLERAMAAPPDALILDMKMPEMGGLEFLRRLRAVASLETLPVGVITGDYFLGEGVLQELTALGATIRYKPIRIEDLATLTEHILGTTPAQAPENES